MVPVVLVGMYCSGAAVSFVAVSIVERVQRFRSGSKRRDVALIAFGTLAWFIYWPMKLLPESLLTRLVYEEPERVERTPYPQACAA